MPSKTYTKNPTSDKHGKKGVRKRPLRAVPDLVEDESSESFQQLLNQVLKDLPEKFLECRSYNRHNLKRLTVFTWGVNNDCTCRVSKCTTCGARVEDYYLPNGKKMDRQYVYPENYLITGYGKIPTDQIMRILLSRIPISDPKDLPNSVTSKLSNKALQAVHGAE